MPAVTGTSVYYATGCVSLTPHFPAAALRQRGSMCEIPTHPLYDAAGRRIMGHIVHKDHSTMQMDKAVEFTTQTAIHTGKESC